MTGIQPKRVLLLGSTGSIGGSTITVARNLRRELRIVALAAHSRWDKLLEQARELEPESVALTDREAARKLEAALAGAGLAVRPRVYSGDEGLSAMVRETPGEIVLGAISGAAGLPANLAALETGKDLALANKESLVMTGALLSELARRNGRRLIPVDSEHSAIFQSLLSGRREEVHSIILTASGGPFRTATLEQIQRATKAQALNHPTWKMGEKITIDSATLMNKALEVIEARWLFDLPPERIRVVIHPQSIIHSLVEFHDGSVICQLGPPDMCIPIQYALTYPERRPLPVKRLRLEEVGSLTFEAPDPGRFPALRLAYEVLEEGGTSPAVFNAANEVAVAAFLREETSFQEILGSVERTLDSHRALGASSPAGAEREPPTGASHGRAAAVHSRPAPPTRPDLQAILAADRWARDEAARQLQPHRHARGRQCS